MSYISETQAQPMATASLAVRSISVSRDIPTDAMRELLSALTEAAVHSIGEDSGVKLITAIATLAKTLRETEQFNASLAEDAKSNTRDYSGDDLDARLKDFQPCDVVKSAMAERMDTLSQRALDERDAAAKMAHDAA